MRLRYLLLLFALCLGRPTRPAPTCCSRWTAMSTTRAPAADGAKRSSWAAVSGRHDRLLAAFQSSTGSGVRSTPNCSRDVALHRAHQRDDVAAARATAVDQHQRLLFVHADRAEGRGLSSRRARSASRRRACLCRRPAHNTAGRNGRRPAGRRSPRRPQGCGKSCRRWATAPGRAACAGGWRRSPRRSLARQV